MTYIAPCVVTITGIMSSRRVIALPHVSHDHILMNKLPNVPMSTKDEFKITYPCSCILNQGGVHTVPTRWVDSPRGNLKEVALLFNGQIS
jgi:hypothetical protein